mmetsp:Transcript_68438/g.194078  ORF Transcript_68438/g.194078 Transcript_68438/m.194078 type:complete len:348 (+) Transcript_68438:1192-2235(+)
MQKDADGLCPFHVRVAGVAGQWLLAPLANLRGVRRGGVCRGVCARRLGHRHRLHGALREVRGAARLRADGSVKPVDSSLEILKFGGLGQAVVPLRVGEDAVRHRPQDARVACLTLFCRVAFAVLLLCVLRPRLRPEPGLHRAPSRGLALGGRAAPRQHGRRLLGGARLRADTWVLLVHPRLEFFESGVLLDAGVPLGVVCDAAFAGHLPDHAAVALLTLHRGVAAAVLGKSYEVVAGALVAGPHRGTPAPARGQRRDAQEEQQSQPRRGELRGLAGPAGRPLSRGASSQETIRGAVAETVAADAPGKQACVCRSVFFVQVCGETSLPVGLVRLAAQPRCCLRGTPPP